MYNIFIAYILQTERRGSTSMEKEQTRFTGILRKIQLMSRVGGLIAPEPDDEAEQRLTLCADGSVN